jgi:hypothetical protein
VIPKDMQQNIQSQFILTCMQSKNNGH